MTLDSESQNPADRERLCAAWVLLTSQGIEQNRLERFLREAGRQLPRGSFAREVARVLSEEDGGTHPPIFLANITSLSCTTRVDGIMPIRLPLASDALRLGRDLLNDLDRLNMPMPPLAVLEPMMEKLAVCFLCWLHGRQMESDNQIRIELRLECPESAMSIKEDLTLMAYLPNAKRATVFYSNLAAKRWLAVPATSLAHYDAVRAVWREGQLRVIGQ